MASAVIRPDQILTLGMWADLSREQRSTSVIGATGSFYVRPVEGGPGMVPVRLRLSCPECGTDFRDGLTHANLPGHAPRFAMCPASYEKLDHDALNEGRAELARRKKG